MNTSPDRWASGALALWLAAGCPTAQTPQFSEIGLGLPGARGRVDSLVVGDVTGDGTTDVLVWNYPSFIVYVNDGAGGFRPTTPVGLGSSLSVSVMKLADLDGDQDLDLVIAGGSLNSQVCFNDGAGNFPDSSLLAVHRSDATSTVVFDVDGDGDRDLVIGSRGGSELFRNNGHGSFAFVRFVTERGSARGLAAGDVDGDGDLDLAVGNAESTNHNQLFLNDGTGRFTDVSATHLPGDADDTLDLAFADVDGDRDLDLMLANGRGPFAAPYSQQNRLYLNDGLGRFTDLTPVLLPPDNQDSESLALRDFDGDGDVDALFGARSALLLYLNDGRGRFADVSGVRLPLQTPEGDRLAADDVDGDGDIDVFATSRVYFNLLRHLEGPRQPSLGTLWSLNAHASPGFAAAPHAVLAFLSLPGPRRAIPALGVSWLDPGSAIPLTPVLIPAPAGVGTISVSVPRDPRFSGLDVLVQGVMVDAALSLSLTNPVVATVL